MQLDIWLRLREPLGIWLRGVMMLAAAYLLISDSISVAPRLYVVVCASVVVTEAIFLLRYGCYTDDEVELLPLEFAATPSRGATEQCSRGES